MVVNTINYKYFYLILFFLGSCLGSFFTLVGSRTARNESIIFPGSHCTECHHQLKFYELIPVISWLFLKGKCRICKVAIPIIYMLLELVSGLMMTVSYYLFGVSLLTVLVMSLYYVILTVTIKRRSN